MRNILLLAFVFIAAISNAQENFKFYAQGMKMISQSQPDWEAQDWDPSDNMLISLRFYSSESIESGSLKIYSKKTQLYELIYTMETPYHSEYKTTKWQAEDDEGYACTVRFLNYHDVGMYDMVVIAYSDFQWAYTITKKPQ